MKPASFSAQARSELRDARRWIARDSPAAARRLQASVNRLAQLLGDNPYLGTERPEAIRRPYRITVVRGLPYLVIYDPTTRPPTLMRFVHGARDLPTVLGEFAPSTEA